MEYRILGSTGIKVSRLCFGSLTIGPLQANLTIEEGAEVIALALEKGINFIDTAMLYQTYPYIKRAVELSKKQDIIISSKSYDYTYEGMKKSVMTTLEELGVPRLSIFSLHEQESRLTLKGHRDALMYLCDAKREGLIDAVGVSTHAIEVVKAAAYMDEIDVIHPIVNKNGLGILDGNIEQMLSAIEIAHHNGKGIYGMKSLGGGNLMKDSDAAFSFVLKNNDLDAIAVGMQNFDEVHANVELFSGRMPGEKLKKSLAERKKNLHIDDWCEGCGKCVEACKNKAMKIVDGKAVVIREKCVLCGYCSAYCKQFCIKVV